MKSKARSPFLAPPAAVGWSLGLHAAALGVAGAAWWWLAGSGPATDSAPRWVESVPAAPAPTWAIEDPEPDPLVSAPTPLPEPGLTETEAAPPTPAPVIEVLAVLPAVVLPLGAPVPDAFALVSPTPRVPPPASAVASVIPPLPAPSRARPPAPDPVLCPAPAYPVAAVRRALEGRVLLEVHVDPAGTPLDVRVAESSGHDLLDRAARATVAEWRFRPAWDSTGRPCTGTIYVPVRFSLDR